MKSTIRSFAALAAIAILAACGGGNAHAAPVAVTNTTGTVVYGSAQAVSAEKDTSAGYNRTIVRYSTGSQYVTDDAAWSKFAKVVSGFYVPVAYGSRVYDISKSNGVYCTNNQSVVSFPNVAPSDTLADNCAFFNAAKAASQ